MAGSNIFAVYTSADGNNVTLSPRLGTGTQMPNFNDDAEVELLEGSGVSNGVMTANVKCSSCSSWSGNTADFTAGSGSWIYAYQASNGPKNTDDQSATIRQHSDRGVFSWNYASAKGGDSVNPLVNAASSGTASGTATGTAVTCFTVIESGNASNRTKMLIAHGVLAALAFVILFPAGAIAIRLASFPGVVMLHAAFQLFAYLVYIAGFGLGVYIAMEMNLLDHYHPIIGILVFVLVFFQPILGFLHHLLFKKYQSRTFWSYAHIWVGRIAITLGIINGGLGLQLADSMGMSSKKGIIAYGVVAGVMWLAWIAAIVIGERRRKARGVAGAPTKYYEATSNNTNKPADDVPMSRVKFNANTEYAYLQNFKILQNTFAKHQVDKPIRVESLVKCKMQDNLEFLQFVKQYWDQHFPGHDYDPVARRKGQAGLASTSAPAPRAAAPAAARRAPAASNTAAPRTRTPMGAGGGAASAALREENTQLKETVTGLERERDFYFSKLRDIELLIQQAMEADPELEKDEGLLKQIQNILYSTEEGFEIPPETEGAEEETF
ncbi:iron reductase domain protein [Dothidotthia symphoricarpi CBS 119687]|uniref:Iron reductase domain protein n=1 Tax=Dothidotthia symphoricarpi CBS 119687 TaxID=1392245 RepID=A0A6A6A0W6_9PLEO|nr:iron reductase domain protein [Dothidotthia symphoricarpi CBS 119687]KAF2125642.1 iron reductase domain protein [Dothidotthia symphoricarpi CBS 119687]